MFLPEAEKSVKNKVRNEGGMLQFLRLTLTDILLTVKGEKYNFKKSTRISFLKYSNNLKRLVFRS